MMGVTYIHRRSIYLCCSDIHDFVLEIYPGRTREERVECRDRDYVLLYVFSLFTYHHFLRGFVALVPVSQFPTPLWQTSRAINHLLTVENVKPSNLVLVGDSAGGNLVSQVLSSMLHPLFSPPIIPSGTQLRGAYMMSPWISLTGVYENQPLRSFTENDHCDIIGKESLLAWGRTVLSGAPNPFTTDFPYLEPIKAPADWYAHLPDVVDRVFVSTGGAECLRDADEILFREKIKPYHEKCEYYEMEGGVHNDPFFDFQVAEGPLGGKRQGLTPRVLEWVWGCFEEDK